MYAAAWNDRLGLYEAAAARQPRSLQVHLLLSNELRERRQFDRADRAAAAARELAPDHPDPYLYAAMVALDRGDLDGASRLVRESMARQPTQEAIAIGSQIRERRAATRPATTAPTE